MMSILNRSINIRIFIITFLCIFIVSFLAKNSKDIKNRVSVVTNSDQKRYVFFDLGANKGDSLLIFLEYKDKGLASSTTISKFGEKAKSSKWEVYGFEANPVFNPILEKVRTQIAEKHSIHLYNETAAWKYDGTIDFYLDTVNAKDNFWGSSLNKEHPDVIQSGQQKVTVKCMDIARLLKQYNENDFIVMKMDIEGAEYELLLDFVKKDVYKLIDFLAVDFHPQVVPFASIEKVYLEIMKLFGTNAIEWH